MWDARTDAASRSDATSARPRAIRPDCSAARCRRLAIIGRWPLPPRVDAPMRPARHWAASRATAFLRRHWQKEPLARRGRRIAGFAGPFTRARALRARAARRRRIAPRRARRERAGRSPTARSAVPTSRRFPRATGRCWCQGVNLVASGRRRAAAPVLVPAVRAPRRPDGELRRAGRRRRAARGLVRRLPAAGLRSAPLALRRAGRITRSCPDGRSRSSGASRPTHDEVLAPGDMLYLPPHVAHDGVAIDACTTYSIGFRAPGANELAAAFLDFLRDELDLSGTLRRPGPRAVRAPAAIGAAMQRRCLQLLKGDRLGPRDGRPLPGLVSVRAEAACVLRAAAVAAVAARPSAARIAKHGVRVDRRTQLLYDRTHLYVNGVAMRWPASGAAALRRLANDRALAPRDADGPAPGSRGDPLQLVPRWLRPLRRRLTAANRRVPVPRYETLTTVAAAGRGDRHADRSREALHPRLRHRPLRDGLERCGARARASRRSCARRPTARARDRRARHGLDRAVVPAAHAIAEIPRPCDRDPPRRRGRAIGDGSADDRRRRAFPAPVPRRAAARGALDRRPGRRRRRSSSASTRSARLRSPESRRPCWDFDLHQRSFKSFGAAHNLFELFG